jgi:hypothetical protein
MQTITRIPSKTNRYGDQLESQTIYVTDARWGLCSIGIIPEGSEGRQEFQGPIVPGPWGFTVTHPAVIDNYGGSGRDMANAPVKIALGDHFTIDGLPGTWSMRERDQRRLEGDGVQLQPEDDAAREVAYR